MSKGNAPRQILTAQPRPGEGPTVDLIQHRVVHVNGQTLQSFTVDLRSAPVPERKYLAESCDVRLRPSSVALLFAQERFGTGGIRSLLVVQVSPSGIARFLKSIDDIKPGIEELAAQLGISADESGVEIEQEPPQTIALSASMILTAVSGDEACLDFFKASPFSMSTAQQTRKLALDPVVRVDLSSSLMLSLVEKMRDIAPQLPRSAFPVDIPEHTDGHD